MKEFLAKKDIVISVKRYGIDALGAMAQGLFCSLLIGTIINTLGTQLNIGVLTMTVATINDIPYTVGGLASAMSGPAMAVAIGYALHCPPLVLFSLISVGFASNALGSSFRRDFCGGDWQSSFKRNQDRYFGDTACDDWCRRRSIRVVGTRAWRCRYESRQSDHVGNRFAAVPDGNSGFRSGRCRVDLADLIRGNLCGAAADRAGRRCCCGRLLRADGRLRGHVL